MNHRKFIESLGLALAVAPFRHGFMTRELAAKLPENLKTVDL